MPQCSRNGKPKYCCGLIVSQFHHPIARLIVISQIDKKDASFVENNKPKTKSTYIFQPVNSPTLP
jgi:hypothetical protein